MLTTFENLPPNQVPLLAQLIQKIAAAIHPDKILCYGYRISNYQDWSCFTEGNGYQETVKPTFDLLVVTNDGNKLADHEILQKIDLAVASQDCEVTAIVQSLDSVNELIVKNSRFLTTLYHKAVLVYNAGNNVLINPPEALSYEQTKSKLETTWNKCFHTAEGFYKTACFYLDNGWNEKALFDLHQAVFTPDKVAGSGFQHIFYAFSVARKSG